jgi:hypothetical protein
MATPTTLTIGDRSDISTEEQFSFCSSPIHLRLQNTGGDETLASAFVYLWIWNGAQNAALGSPNIVLSKSKVSASDKYINLQIADFIRSFLEAPANAPNTNQPNFVYNELTEPAITGQGVFWQIQADITSTAGTVRVNYPTRFATLGYRWRDEQSLLGSNGLTPGGSTGFFKVSEKWYNPKIHNYFSQVFDLTKTVATATTANMITRTPVTPPAAWERCSRDPSLIVYLNKLGLWEQFTPHGKISVSSKIDSQVSNKLFRDPSIIDNTFTHSKLRRNLDVTQSYTINTGSLTENMITKIEEIIYSPKVYLILFNGDVQETPTLGITIDSTFITIDDTNITIDSTVAPAELIGSLKTFDQIPVIITDSDFQRKTRINDKNEINYNLKMEETANKLLDIR